jgi:hypothetical protein
MNTKKIYIKRNYMRSIIVLLVASFCSLAADPIYTDDTDLVLADITGSNQIQKGMNTKAFKTKGNAVFKFVGPGSVKHSYTNTESESTYSNGVHAISITNDAVTTWNGGNLFLKMYPQVEIQSNSLSDYSLYAPVSSSGLIDISSSNRLDLLDSNDQLLILTPSANSSVLATGKLDVKGNTMNGTQSSGNINPYLSPYADLMLMTEQMAIDDGLLYQQVTTTNKDLTMVLTTMNSIMDNLQSIKSSLVTGTNSSSFPELVNYNDDELQGYLGSIENKYRDINRSNHLDKLDLVLVNLIPNSPSTTDATVFKTTGYARYVFIGPGEVSIGYENGTNVVKSFNSNAHMFHIKEEATVTWNGGQLFLDMFPEVHKLTSQQSQHWIYLPSNTSSRVDIRSESAISIYDGVSEHIIAPEVDTSNINIGHVALDDSKSNSIFTSGNANRYLSPYANKTLMPKDLAVSEGLSYTEVTNENWTNEELVYHYLIETIDAFKNSMAAVKNLQYK